MKKLLLLPALYAGMLHAQFNNAASWQDVNTFTYATKQGGVATTTDGTYEYVVGTFENTIVFPTSPTATTLSSGSDVDIFVAKYNSSGTCLAAVQLGDAGLDDEAYSITYQTVSSTGYVFVGVFIADEGHVFKLSASNLSTSIDADLGAFIYPRSLNGYGTGGQVLIGGSFTQGSCSLPKSSGYINLTASNASATVWQPSWHDAFCGILDGNCYFTYAANPNNSTGENEIMSIWGRNQRIYCTGYFRNNMKWASSSSTVTALGVQDAFVASAYIPSFTSCSLNNDFVRAGSQESAPMGNPYFDPYWRECGYGISANGTAIYITGNLMNASTSTFGSTNYTGAGAFVARVNYNGSNVGTESWVRLSEDATSGTAAARSIGYGIALDANGDIWSTGRCQDNVQFQGGSNADIQVSPTGTNEKPGYISKYNSTGNILNANPINEIGLSTTEGRGIVANGCDVYTTGWSTIGTQFQTGALTAENIASNQCAMFMVAFSRDADIQNDISVCMSCALLPYTGTLTATGGTSYTWSPGTWLSATNVAAPNYSINTCTATVVNYSVTIATASCTTTALLNVTTTLQPSANAGADIAVCPLSSYYIGATGTTGFTYSWLPNDGHLTAYNIAHPAFSTSTTTVLPITYTLTQTDPCGNVTTDQVTVTAAHCRMANPDGTEQTAEIFPNPSAGIFTVNLAPEESAAAVEFVVTDLTGRVVQKNTVTTAGGPVTIDLSGQAKGMYVLSVTRNGVTEKHELIVE